MNDSTIRLSADTSALSDFLSKIADEMTAMKDSVSSSAAAMGANLDASAKQAEATNAAIHGLDDSVKTVTDSINEQTKTVTDLGTQQSKVTKEISKALSTQNTQQKDTNTTLAKQKKIMQEQEAEIKKVTKAVDTQTGVLQKNAGCWKMLMTGFAIKFASEIVDGFKSIISTGLEASRVYEDMSARLTPLVGDLETAQKTFWSLNGLKDETATATDKLAKAFVDLGNNGLTNSNEQLKTYATIAHGTGRDINTLTDAVIAFSQGSTKALRQFGITAKDKGDTISLTYKGSTTEIQKNSKALDEYLSNLARNNFDGVMEAKLNTVSAATGRLDNAWGTFCTRLMQSDGGFGELIIMGNDFLANTLNGICRKVVVFMLVGIASILDTRIFQTGKDGSRQASCNYAIGTDGIIGLCVDEQNRSWCSSSRDNDQRAVTIECASDLTDPYAMKPEVYSALMDLSTDICRRNGKRKLVWIADRDKALIYEVKPDEMLLTIHRWFAKKSCPGNWLFSKLGDLAQAVNSRLGV